MAKPVAGRKAASGRTRQSSKELKQASASRTRIKARLKAVETQMRVQQAVVDSLVSEIRDWMRDRDGVQEKLI